MSEACGKRGAWWGVLKLFKKTLFLNGTSPGPIIEEEKQDVNREFGFHSMIYSETRTGAGKALSM